MLINPFSCLLLGSVSCLFHMHKHTRALHKRTRGLPYHYMTTAQGPQTAVARPANQLTAEQWRDPLLGSAAFLAVESGVG